MIMRKILTLAALFLFLGNSLFAQQDPMFTKYMFNSLIFNPAYAGSKDYMYAGLLYRSQWVGIDGAPSTQTATLHTPLRNERVGVGLSLINDEIGPTQTIGANLAYAYRIPLDENQKNKLSIGLQGGIENYQANWSELNLENPDNAFAEDVNTMLPNFGVGVYFYNDGFYLGASVPHLIEYDLREGAETEIYARQARHYYFTGGAAIPLNGDALIFKPSALVKAVGLLKSQSKLEAFRDIGAPVEFDIDLSLMFQQTLWVGTSFRSAVGAFGDNPTSSFDSVDLWASVFLKNGLRIGAAYDYPLNALEGVTPGSFEIMLGYEFNYKQSKMATPRYF